MSCAGGGTDSRENPADWLGTYRVTLNLGNTTIEGDFTLTFASTDSIAGTMGGRDYSPQAVKLGFWNIDAWLIWADPTSAGTAQIRIADFSPGRGANLRRFGSD